MKTLRFAAIIGLMAIALCGCSSPFGDVQELVQNSKPVPRDYYYLHINVRNTEGDDLVAPLGEEYYKSNPESIKYSGEVNPDKYQLQIVLPDGYVDRTASFTLGKFDGGYNWVSMQEDGTYDVTGRWSLMSNYMIVGNNPKVQNPLTYKIKCPAVFGDDTIHEIVTWWEAVSWNKTLYEQFYGCVKATFDGVEISPVRSETVYPGTDFAYAADFLDIVLD